MNTATHKGTSEKSSHEGNNDRQQSNNSSQNNGQGLLVSFGGAGGNAIAGLSSQGRNSSQVPSSNKTSLVTSSNNDSMEKDKRITLAQICEADPRAESSTVVGVPRPTES